MVHRVVWRVGGPEAIDFWAQRLVDEGVATEREGERPRFADPEGLDHELVVTRSPDEPLAAEHRKSRPSSALQGFDGVRAFSDDPERSRALLERVLGARAGGSAQWELRGERRGGYIT